MNYVCRQLGLPLSTVQLLKLPEDQGSQKVEAAVEKIMEEDKEAGRVPILCVANVHSSLIQVRRG